MEKNSKKLFNGTVQARQRRARVISRLEKQLKSGTKPNPEKIAGNSSKIPLSESDIVRIGKEIEILKQRI